ncbi:type II toxin-antitoxin system RelE/ParE family toxin [Sinorhizobium sp. 7-81]|uniref:type II toxin-antitoxin system RelE/ParE family toxin n=1 Tax=unclassified Sinorhizobium TaxID=2613772 RepID=UPI0024C4636A|nr:MULTISPECIES: type II toxin-antitoxin system RelE/ParE family toxin [unclassified Sinorhizobium]MDK1390158.1 type II toxin-antitoxin system RelE/ParE family toxin [Sinorhizobium sp. 7-81]MDK1492959.1 type II toxin-antitoxin system RelE/ParE family toxin [Sinorhizobium sp. 8-89]
MKVRFTTEAKADLQQIGDYIAKDNPSRALSFVDELEQKCLTLATSSKAFPLVPRYEHHGVRRRVHGSYLIFYRVEAEQVVIVHVLHGAMEYAAILFEG